MFAQFEKAALEDPPKKKTVRATLELLYSYKDAALEFGVIMITDGME